MLSASHEKDEVFYPGVGVTFDKPLPPGHYHLTETTHPSGVIGWRSYRAVCCHLDFRKDMNPPVTYINRGSGGETTNVDFNQVFGSGVPFPQAVTGGWGSGPFPTGHPAVQSYSCGTGNFDAPIRHVSHMGLYEGLSYWSSVTPDNHTSRINFSSIISGASLGWLSHGT